jgi:hypothetical protein
MQRRLSDPPQVKRDTPQQNSNYQVENLSIRPQVSNASYASRDAAEQQVYFRAGNSLVQPSVRNASTVRTAQQPARLQSGNPFFHPLAANSSTVNRALVQQQVNIDADNPFFRKAVPADQSYYSSRLQCFLMNHLQEALQNEPLCPQNFFINNNVIEELIYHKTFALDNPILYESVLTSLPGINHVDISIYVYKAPAGLCARGRSHYRVDAFAVPFGETGWIVHDAYGDLCRGFLSMEWYNDKSLYTFDWDHMEFKGLLRLLRRAAMRNFDDQGNLRPATEQVRIEAGLGDLYPGRVGQRPSALAAIAHTFRNRGPPVLPPFNNPWANLSSANSSSVQ